MGIEKNFGHPKKAKEETLIDKADEVASGWIVEIKVQFEIQFEILEFIEI